MFVLAARPRSSKAWRRRPRLSSAFRMAAREVGPLMPGGQGVETVALGMLCAVGITRPVDQHERFVAGLENRQHDLGGDVNEVGLLLNIGDGGAGGLEIADLGIFALRWRRQRQARSSQCDF